MPAVSSDHVAAEALVARLGALAAAPAHIVWERGLRRDHGLNGWTSPLRPSELHVDPDAERELVLRTAAHEWIHSLEFRGIIPREIILVDGTHCSVLARSQGSAIAGQAVISPAHVALPELLVAAIVAHTGRPPSCFAGTRRSSR
jgi:hypothetical protein